MSNLTYYYFSEKEVESFRDKVEYTFVNGVVAVGCLIIAIINFLVLVTSYFFRQYSKVLIALALASILALVSIAYQNFHQYDQYVMILEYKKLPEKTSWDCALLPWVWLKLISDLWPPALIALMGVERVVAVFSPMYYRNVWGKRVTTQLGITVVFVLVSVIVAYVLAATNVVPGFGTCGRKNAFSRDFGVYLYLVNILGYLVSFVLSFVAFVKAQGSRHNVPMLIRRKQLVKARYYVLLSFIGMVCIAAPNVVSIINAFFPKLPNSISKPATWMACANFASNFFVYLFLNPEYRQKCQKLLKRSKSSTVVTVLKAHDEGPRKSTSQYF